MVVAFHYLYRGQRPGWIASHAPAALENVASYGFLGVNLFFMISGFVVFMSAENSTVRSFAASRAARLYPAFWIAAPLTALIAWKFDSPYFQTDPLTLAANLTMAPHWFGFAFVDGAYWSIAVELHFYIAIGIVLAAGWMKRAQWLVLGWLVVSLIYAVRPIYFLDLWLNARWAPYFCAGICAYLIRTRDPSRLRIGLFAAAYVLALVDSLNPFFRRETPDMSAQSPWVVGLSVTAFHAIFLAIAFNKWRIRASRLTSWAGRSTYSVYLLHQNIGYVLLAALAPLVQSFTLRLVVVVVTIACATWVVVRFVEEPLGHRVKSLIGPQRPRRRPPT